MSSQRIHRLTKDYKALMESGKNDIDLICAVASKCKKVLVESPELIDDAFKESSLESVKILCETRAELELEVTALEDAAAQPGAGGLAQELEKKFKRSPRRRKGTGHFIEFKQLERIFNPETADLEVVEETQQGVRMDPLTQRPIKVLVQNKRCKHYYCYETIKGHINSGPYPRCPIAGCSLPHIKHSDLEFID